MDRTTGDPTGLRHAQVFGSDNTKAAIRQAQARNSPSAFLISLTRVRRHATAPLLRCQNPQGKRALTSGSGPRSQANFHPNLNHMEILVSQN